MTPFTAAPGMRAGRLPEGRCGGRKKFGNRQKTMQTVCTVLRDLINDGETTVSGADMEEALEALEGECIRAAFEQ